jgi:hypothetical protein
MEAPFMGKGGIVGHQPAAALFLYCCLMVSPGADLKIMVELSQKEKTKSSIFFKSLFCFIYVLPEPSEIP